MLVIFLMWPVVNRSEENEVLRARHFDRLRARAWGYSWDAKVGLTKHIHYILNDDGGGQIYFYFHLPFRPKRFTLKYRDVFAPLRGLKHFADATPRELKQHAEFKNAIKDVSWPGCQSVKSTLNRPQFPRLSSSIWAWGSPTMQRGRGKSESTRTRLSKCTARAHSGSFIHGAGSFSIVKKAFFWATF